MNHFDEMTALLYLEGQLDADRAQEVAAHRATCSTCRELLGALEREGVWLRQTLTAEDEAIPARLLEAPERAGAPWGWITALGLSAGGAYTVWSGIVEPWRAQAAQAGFTQGNLLTMLFFSGAFWKGWDAMRSLMEFAAMATLTVLVSWLLRRHWHRLTSVAVVMGALLWMLALPSPTGAAETKRGDPNFTLASGETVHTDLFVLAERTEVDGDVDGDLVVWSREVIVNGHVKGDILCGAESLRINGTVDGNVRSFAHSVDISGTVGKNFMTSSGEANLEDKGSIGGSVTFAATDAWLAGQVGGDLLGVGRSVNVTGKVGGDAKVRADSLTIGSSAEIKGHTTCVCERDPEIAPGAKLAGSIKRVIRKRETRYDQARFYWHRVLLWGVGFLYGLVLLLLVPGFYADATAACKKYVPAAGFGLLFLFATPIAAIIACFTIVGLAVGITTLLLYAIAFFSSTVFVAGWLGEALLGSKPGMGAAIGRLALGLFILHVLRVLPYVGGWILFLTIIWGLGALAMAIYKHLRPQLVTAPAV
jgi:cytoskeletal protein CcmA (bactofilin family)